MPPPPDSNAWSSVAFAPPVESVTFTPKTVLNEWFCAKPTQESKCCVCFQKPGVQPSPPGVSMTTESEAESVMSFGKPTGL